MVEIKIIDYTGRYPTLCFGTLVLEVNGKRYELDNALRSGGHCGFGATYADEIVEEGDWKAREENLPDELKPLVDKIEDAVNKQLECRGCCGGCL